MAELSEFEKVIQQRMNQLSPEERNIQRSANVREMGKKQIGMRNAKAQAYLDKKAAEKAPSLASKAGRNYAKAAREVKNFGPNLVKGVKAEAKTIAKIASKAAPVLKAAAPALKVAGRAAAPVIEAARAARLLTSEDYRKQNEEAYDELGDKNVVQRAIEGGLGGVSTIYAMAKNLADTAGANEAAKESEAAYLIKKQELMDKGLIDGNGQRVGKMAPAEPTEPAKPAESSSIDSDALIAALGEAPPVQPAETAPRTAEVEAAYKEIEAGNVPKAIPVNEEAVQPELDENRMATLFRTTTGTSFNPKSKADAGRMAQLRDFVGSNPDMLNKSDTRIALDFYRTL